MDELGPERAVAKRLSLWETVKYSIVIGLFVALVRSLCQEGFINTARKVLSWGLGKCKRWIVIDEYSHNITLRIPVTGCSFT